MRMFVICLVIILSATIISLANSDSVKHLSLQGPYNNYSLRHSTNKIFYQDKANKLLLIDFNAINDKLIKVRIEKDNVSVLEDTVSDLSKEVVYEVDLNKYGKGNYIIYLTTIQEKLIIEKFSVQE